MKLQILVIDDDVSESSRLLDYCADAFPDAVIIQDRRNPTTFHSDAEVQRFIETIPDGDDVVVFLDLLLRDPPQHTDAAQGKRTAESLRARRPRWIIIAMTRWVGMLKAFPDWEEVFHGLLEKAGLDAAKHRSERVALVKAAAVSALNRRLRKAPLFPSDIKVKDSLGMRLFRVAFGDETLAEILRNEAADWKHVEVEALTSGHSGAFLLALSGTSGDGHNSLIVKAALNPAIVQNELSSLDTYLGQLGDFLPLALFDKTPRQLYRGGGIYYRQARVLGKTLLEALISNTWAANKRILQPLIKKCVEWCHTLPAENLPRKQLRHVMTFSPIDIGRLESSSKFLFEFRPALREKGFWPENLDRVDVGQKLLQLLNEWETSPVTAFETYCRVQHGDFNPGNILIQPPNAFTLIDLGRLGIWPLGYDIARLGLMLRLRLMDAPLHQDWLPERLTSWLREPIGAGLVGSPAETALCPEALYCEQEYRGFLGRLTAEVRVKLLQTYIFCNFYDLIKIVSYQDISLYKRIWALSEAVRLNEQLHSMLPP